MQNYYTNKYTLFRNHYLVLTNDDDDDDDDKFQTEKNNKSTLYKEVLSVINKQEYFCFTCCFGYARRISSYIESNYLHIKGG